MGMIDKFYNHITMYYEERDDATAGKIRRLHDWLNVSRGGISGWTPRPQRFIGEGFDIGASGWSKDNMADVTWDSLEKWDDRLLRSDRNSKNKIMDNSVEIHRLCEMPVAYSRTKVGPG